MEQYKDDTAYKVMQDLKALNRGNIFDIAVDTVNRYMDNYMEKNPELEYINYLKAVDLWFVLIKVLNSGTRNSKVNINKVIVKINKDIEKRKLRILNDFKTGRLKEDLAIVSAKEKLTMHDEYYSEFLHDYAYSQEERLINDLNLN